MAKKKLDTDAERKRLTKEYSNLVKNAEHADELREVGMRLAKLDAIDNARELAKKNQNYKSIAQTVEDEYNNEVENE